MQCSQVNLTVAASVYAVPDFNCAPQCCINAPFASTSTSLRDLISPFAQESWSLNVKHTCIFNRRWLSTGFKKKKKSRETQVAEVQLTGDTNHSPPAPFLSIWKLVFALALEIRHQVQSPWRWSTLLPKA